MGISRSCAEAHSGSYLGESYLSPSRGYTGMSAPIHPSFAQRFISFIPTSTSSTFRMAMPFSRLGDAAQYSIRRSVISPETWRLRVRCPPP